MSFDPSLLAMPAFEENADLNADVTAGSELPPEGEELTLKFTPIKPKEGTENVSEKGVVVSLKDGKVTIAFRYVAEVTEGPHAGKRFFGRMSNQVMTWKGNATEISAFIRKCGMGHVLVAGVTAQDLVDALHACFEADASIAGCKVRWQGQYVPEDADPTNPEKKIRRWKDAKEVCKSMKAFPLKDPSDLSKGYESKYAWPGEPTANPPIPPTTIYAECRLAQLGYPQ